MASLEVRGPHGAHVVQLVAERVTVGALPLNDLSLEGDRSVSRLHAVFERFDAGWCVRDLSSRNGTFINGERVFGEKALRSGDEVRVGTTRLVYWAGTASAAGPTTEAEQAPPPLTRREHDVLLALCRPVLAGDLFTEPASIAQIAEDLVVTQAAVKQHLIRLYEKFGLYDRSRQRRAMLANEAVRRGAVAIADLHDRYRGAGG